MTAGPTATSTATSTRARRPALTRANRIGLVLSALLAVTDVLALGSPAPGPGENGPPFAVLVVGAALGVLTLVFVVMTWVGGRRLTARLVAGTRLLSVVLGLPAFFVSDVPAGVVAASGVITVLAVLAIVLVLRRPQPTV